MGFAYVNFEYCKKLITILLVAFSTFFRIFASYQNPTDGYTGFNLTTSNIILYCVLPLLIKAIILSILVFRALKKKENPIFTSIIFILAFIVMLAYSIFIATICTEGWVLIASIFNTISLLVLLSGLILPLALRNKLNFIKKFDGVLQGFYLFYTKI